MSHLKLLKELDRKPAYVEHMMPHVDNRRTSYGQYPDNHIEYVDKWI